MSKILIIDPLPPSFVAGIRQAMPAGVDLDCVVGPEPEEFARRAADAEVLLVVSRRVDAPLLALAPQVRLVQRFGVGYDNLDLAALAAAGVPAAFTPGANADAVAEHTILLMLALLKRLPAADAATRRGEWPAQALVQAGLGDLAAATVGLVGFGHIGRAVAARLRPFGCQLLYTARHPLGRERDELLGVEYVPLPELLRRASIVSLHVPLTAETRHLIGAEELARMQQGAVLINTSRGAVLDETALRQSLDQAHLGGAGLDVLADEQPGGNPFADLTQVVVTPHVAGASAAAARIIFQQAAANVKRYLAGQPVLDLVPKQ